MKQSRFSEEQIIGILKQQESGRTTAGGCREAGIRSATFYVWKAKFGGMSDAQRLRQLEAENVKLKRVVADLTIDNVALKDVLAKNGEARNEERYRGLLTNEPRLVAALGGGAGENRAQRVTLQSKCQKCETVRAWLEELAQQRPCFGHRRLHVLLWREGIVMNRKKTPGSTGRRNCSCTLSSAGASPAARVWHPKPLLP